MGNTSLTRRTVLQGSVLATATLAAPFVRGAYAAGKLSFGVWDHWVPKESEVMVKLCNEWAAKEKVDITVDLITSDGDKDVLTLMGGGASKVGPRHHGPAHMVRLHAGRQVRAGRRYREPADREIWEDQPGVRVSR